MRAAKLVVKRQDRLHRVLWTIRRTLAAGGGQRGVPVVAQRFHHRGDHQTLDVGARGVVRAQAPAFLGIQRLFEQRTEDRGIDLAPVRLGRVAQFGDFFAAERYDRAVLEELAVEASNLHVQRVGEIAGVHRLP